MKRPRRNHTAAFKARVAKEAIRGIKTVRQIAQENELHPMQVSGWKKDLEMNLPSIFERKNTADDEKKDLETQCERLERKVGQLVIERDWLEKKCDELGIS